MNVKALPSLLRRRHGRESQKLVPVVGNHTTVGANTIDDVGCAALATMPGDHMVIAGLDGDPGFGTAMTNHVGGAWILNHGLERGDERRFAAVVGANNHRQAR